MRIYKLLCALSFCIFAPLVLAQQIAAPEPQPGSIVGTVTDVQDGVVPGATIVLTGPAAEDRRTITSDDAGSFEIKDLRPAVSYQVTINAKGFAEWKSTPIVLTPGQSYWLGNVKMTISVVQTTVAAETIEQIALEQVQLEEKQRVLGIIPNFYVVYDKNAVPLTTKLKFQLALRTSVDPMTIAGVGVLAGMNQAGNTPDYQLGAKGYGQRFGAAAADGFSGILIGGAILPSLLHQDPRYFYQGTGTKKSRALHALSSPFLCKGDNGRWQFNYSSIGGDLASGALSNLYYPDSNRGAGLTFQTALITTGGRIAKSLAQEFILGHFTTNSRNQN